MASPSRRTNRYLPLTTTPASSVSCAIGRILRAGLARCNRRARPDHVALVQRKRQALLRLALRLRERLDNLASRACFRLPFELVRAREHRLDDLETRTQRATKQHLAQLRERLLAQAARLGALSPLNVLARGYSLTRREKDFAVVRLGSEVVPGSRLLTDVQHARLTSVVTSIEPVDRRITPRPNNASPTLFQN